MYGMNGWCKPDGDLISRAEAIDDLHGKDPSQIWDTADIEVWVNALPSAQPKRKRGKWIYGEDEYGIDGYHCNQCGFFVPWDYAHKFINYIEDYHFCPNCGADMKGEDDE